jgi:hypothetical protein
MPAEDQIATLARGDYVSRKVWEWLQKTKAIGYVPWLLDPKSPQYDPAKVAAQAARDELLAELEEVIATASTAEVRVLGEHAGSAAMVECADEIDNKNPV